LIADAPLRVGTAESMTGGLVAAALVDVPGSGEWFAGGVVAYASELKRSVLGVRARCVISRRAACEMALGAAQLLDVDLAISTTGCAGPEPMDGQPVGTTWIGVALRGRAHAVHARFDGEPASVRAHAVRAAFDLACQELRRWRARPSASPLGA
jgi:PncC family amidohydrolase